jgi:hypothetical protein
MKKIFFIIFFSLVGFFVFKNIKRQDQPTNIVTKLVITDDNDSKTDKKQESPQVITKKETSKTQIPKSHTVSKDTKPSISTQNLISCLTRKSCKDEESNHPYRDPNNTTYHRSLIYKLERIEEAVARGKTNIELSADDLINAFKIENRDIRMSSLALIASFYPNKIIETFDIAKDFSGDAASDYLKFISSKTTLEQKEMRSKRDRLLNDYIAQGDQFTLSSLAMALPQVELNISEIDLVLSNFCQRKLPKKTQAQKMIWVKYDRVANKFDKKLKCN